MYMYIYVLYIYILYYICPSGGLPKYVETKNRLKIFLMLYTVKEKLYGHFLWMGFNCLKARAILRR